MMSDPLWINPGKGESVGTATIEADDELLTIATHGLSDGDTVTVDTLTGGASGVLVVDAVYFVRDALTNTFALSLTPAGPLVAFGTDGGADVYRYAPQYHAQELRRSQRMLLFGGHSHRFGARQGIHPSNAPGISVSGTTWTQEDLVAVVYPGLTSQSGPYVVQKPEESGSLDPADGSNPRIDALDLLIEDDDEDSTGERQATVVYVAGTPASSPSAPSVTTNALRLGTILVPAGGSPSPSVATLGAMTVAAGGIAPVDKDADLPTVGRYEGMAVYHQTDNYLGVFDGSAFLPLAAPLSPTLVKFEANGSFVKADHPWAHRYKLRIKGGGGSGGGAAATSGTEHAEGGGGGSGEYVEKTGNISDLPTSVTVTIGAGGAASSAGGNGNAGGTTSFGSIADAGGGGGGTAGPASSTAAGVTGGSGGTGGTGGGVHIPGERGGTGRVIGGSAVKANHGGGGPLSGSVSSGVTTSSGVAGQAYGGGSTGATNGTTQSARASLAGAAGVVILELY